MRKARFILYFALFAAFALPLRAQSTIIFTDGQTSSNNYDTTAPNSPTTFTIATGAATVGSLTGAGYASLNAGTLTGGGDNTSTTFSGNISGSLQSNVINQGTIAFNRAADYYYDWTISGSGGLTLNNGILRFINRQTYTGPTQINAGARMPSAAANSPTSSRAASNSPSFPSPPHGPCSGLARLRGFSSKGNVSS